MSETVTPRGYGFCDEHKEMAKGWTKVEVILGEVRDTLKRVCEHYDEHIALAGHPLMLHRVNSIETVQAQQVATLAAISETTRTNTLTLEAIQKSLDERREDRVLQLDWKTKVLGMVLGLCGPAVALVAILYKSRGG